MMVILAIAAILFTIVPVVRTEILEATIYGDNWFAFYVNGQLIKDDPMDFTPHQALKFTFDVDTSNTHVYAIKARDWADSATGYEYMETDHAAIGGGGLKVMLSDGTVSSSQWKCYVISTGPTTESQNDGCDKDNFSKCKVDTFPEPSGWTSVGFDDSTWDNAVEFTDDYTGWGRTPTYSSGQCCCMTDPVTGEYKDPDELPLGEDECLAPKFLDWGEATFIWTSDLYKDNEVLCRLEVSKGSAAALPSPSLTSLTRAGQQPPPPATSRAGIRPANLAEVSNTDATPLTLGVFAVAFSFIAVTLYCMFPVEIFTSVKSITSAAEAEALLPKK